MLDPGTPPSTQESNVTRLEDPGFVAPLLDDYALREDSPAIDLCSWLVLSGPTDLLGSPRGVALRLNPALRFDAGAFERQPLFADDFEG